MRLALGYSALALAAACFAWDYKLGFDATKHVTAAAVVLYSLLNGALTLWMWLAERGVVYEGTTTTTTTTTGKGKGKGSETTVRIATSVPRKHDPTYHMTIEVVEHKAGGGGGKTEKIEISRPFAEWFDAAGHFVAAPFQSVLATAVPVIGRLDPKRVVGSSSSSSGEGGKQELPAYTPEMLAMLAEANASVVGSAAETASGAEPSGKKGGKRRKA